MLVAFVTGVLVEGFSTLIAKSFSMTGRVASTKRRLQQNNRHMMDIFFPRGLYRENDGWKLSTRIRFVHSRIRTLLDKSEDWNHEAWGRPVSAAHLGFAISVFSKRLLEYSLQVGAHLDKEERVCSQCLALLRLSHGDTRNHPLCHRRRRGRNVQARIHVRADTGRRFHSGRERVDPGHSVGRGCDGPG